MSRLRNGIPADWAPLGKGCGIFRGVTVINVSNLHRMSLVSGNAG